MQSAVFLNSIFLRLFFRPVLWDSCRTRLGLLGFPVGLLGTRREKAAIDLINVDAPGLAGAADDADTGQFGEMAGHRAFADSGNIAECADRRPASAITIGKPHQTLQRPAQVGLQGAIELKNDRDIGEHWAASR